MTSRCSRARALALDPAAHRVDTEGAGPWHYGRLLVATGVRPLLLQAPGAGLAGVHYLRTVADAVCLRGAIDAAVARGGRAVVVGGGFIALEMAAAFVLHGLRVTLVARRSALFEKLGDPGISDYLRARYEARGVEVLFDEVAAFEGGERVELVRTAGGRHLPCALVGIGIVSNSPLELLMEHCGSARKRVFVVDLFPSANALPTKLMEVLGRRDEIVYAERIRRDGIEVALLRDFRKLVEGILAYATSPARSDQVRQWPTYIQLMGDQDAAPDITRIVREGSDSETAGRDYDFSAATIEGHINAGRASRGSASARGALGQPGARRRRHGRPAEPADGAGAPVHGGPRAPGRRPGGAGRDHG
jgi:hypothetical protein